MTASRRRVLPGYARPAMLAASIAVAAACGKPASVAAPPYPAMAGSAQPHLATAPDGGVVMSWLEPDDVGHRLQFAVYDRGAWSEPSTVSSGEDWFVNWADFPSVVPISESLWGAHWLRKTPGTSYSYDVVLSTSTDGGRTWTDGIVPHDDQTPTEHGFVSLFPDQAGLAALWLDGRETQGDLHGNEQSAGGMTLRSAALTGDGRVVESRLVDDLVCDCCQTDVALTPEGPVAVYRNRTEDEIRDIFVARQVNGDWVPEVAVADDGWEIAGCPVNGPSISAGNGLVAVAWFTAANEAPRVRVAFSADSGRSFGAPIDVDSSAPIGRVASLPLDASSSLVAWIAESEGAGASLVAARIGVSGTTGKPVVISPVASGRSSGFPQIARTGEYLLFAWTHVEDGETSVRTALHPVAAFEQT